MAMDKAGISRFAILYPNNTYGHFLMSLFYEGVHERGGKITGAASYEQEETDFAEAISLPNSTQWQVYFDRTPREIASWYLN